MVKKNSAPKFCLLVPFQQYKDNTFPRGTSVFGAIISLYFSPNFLYICIAIIKANLTPGKLLEVEAPDFTGRKSVASPTPGERLSFKQFTICQN